MSDPLILKEMSKSFGGVVAVDGVSFTLGDGERHAILGPNGAGKTTLFNLISGIHPATSGRILLFGKDVTDTPQHVRVLMGLGRTFQVTNLFQSLTVFENILLAAQAQKSYSLSPFKPAWMYKGLLSEVHDILSQWNLDELKDLEVSTLSYGDQRQLEVIMALATSPRILLLDEPTAGLSPSETTEMTRFLGRLDQSTTLLLIEHDMDVVFAIADRITVMHYGRIIAQGPPETIKGDPRVMEIYLGTEWEKHAVS